VSEDDEMQLLRSAQCGGGENGLREEV
jgi:hypothetical protein